MLPKLPDTDIFSSDPDASGLDIWSESFSRRSLPEAIGVYCFYDPVTNEPKYIGSACSSPQPSQGLGFWLRIQTYIHPRKNRADRTEHIGKLVKERSLLLKLWITLTEGDAHKYETDAIVKYKPDLNRKHNGHTTYEERLERVRASIRASGERRKQNIIYEPDAERQCFGLCGQVKKCREFSRHPRMKFGVYSQCKLCKTAEARARKIMLRKSAVD